MLPPPGLLADAVQRTGSQVVAQFAGYRDPTSLCRVLVLPVAPTGCDKNPAVLLQLMKKALSGDPAAIKTMVELMKASDPSKDEPQSGGLTFIIEE